MSAGKCYFVRREGASSAAYACDICGNAFVVGDGEAIECPTCAAVENAPDLCGCPHCGGYVKLEMAWEEKGLVKPVFRAICQTCGCQTRAFNYADDAAASLNDRVEGCRWPSRSSTRTTTSGPTAPIAPSAVAG